jgi:hypothetical protein
MISGAGQADAALLLVDGSPGGFEAGFFGEGAGDAGAGDAFGGGMFPGGAEASGGQTREHAQLARSLGVEQMAVVISKLDTCDYSQVRGLRGWLAARTGGGAGGGCVMGSAAMVEVIEGVAVVPGDVLDLGCQYLQEVLLVPVACLNRSGRRGLLAHCDEPTQRPGGGVSM